MQRNLNQFKRDDAAQAALQSLSDQALMAIEREGEDLIALGAFSKKAAEVGLEIAKEVKAQNETNEMYDFLTGGSDPDLADDAVDVAQAEAEADATSTAAAKVEQQMRFTYCG